MQCRKRGLLSPPSHTEGLFLLGKAMANLADCRRIKEDSSQLRHKGNELHNDSPPHVLSRLSEPSEDAEEEEDVPGEVYSVKNHCSVKQCIRHRDCEYILPCNTVEQLGKAAALTGLKQRP